MTISETTRQDKHLPFHGVPLSHEVASLMIDLTYDLATASDRLLWCVLESLPEESRQRLHQMSADNVSWDLGEDLGKDLIVTRSRKDKE